MHPLLVSAVASTAGNFLDRWARGAGAGPAGGDRSFQAVLDETARTNGTAAASGSREHSPAHGLRELAARLRAQLLEAPEVRAVLDSSDPGKPTTIEVSPDGQVLATVAGGVPKPILLSPETAKLARSLAAFSPGSAAHTLPLGSGVGTFSRRAQLV